MLTYLVNNTVSRAFGSSRRCVLLTTGQPQLPEGNDTVCEVDDTFELYPGVTTSQILANMPSTGI